MNAWDNITIYTCTCNQPLRRTYVVVKYINKCDCLCLCIYILNVDPFQINNMLVWVNAI